MQLNAHRCSRFEDLPPTAFSICHFFTLKTNTNFTTCNLLFKQQVCVSNDKSKPKIAFLRNIQFRCVYSKCGIRFLLPLSREQAGTFAILYSHAIYLSCYRQANSITFAFYFSVTRYNQQLFLFHLEKENVLALPWCPQRMFTWIVEQWEAAKWILYLNLHKIKFQWKKNSLEESRWRNRCAIFF